MFHSTIAVVMPPKKKKKTVTTSLDAPSTSTAEIAELKASNMDLVKRVETLTELVSASLQKKDESQDIVNGVKEVHKDKTRITRSSTQDKDKSIDDDESKDTEEQEQEGQVVKPNQVLEPGKHSNNVAGPSKEDLKLDEDVISAALQKTFGTVDTNKGECLTSFLVAGFTLDTKIKNKIWAGQYVELGSLIPRNEYASTVHMAYAPASISQVSPHVQNNPTISQSGCPGSAFMLPSIVNNIQHKHHSCSHTFRESRTCPSDVLFHMFGGHMMSASVE